MKGRIVWKTLLFLTLVILAVTLVVLPGQKLLGTANQVTWQKTVLAGNEDAAEGILLNAEMNAGRILFWIFPACPMDTGYTAFPLSDPLKQGREGWAFLSPSQTVCITPVLSEKKNPS